MNALKARVVRSMIDDGMLAEACRTLKYVRFPKHARILGDSVKVKKGLKRGVLTAVVYLAPAGYSVRYGGFNACRHASPGCAKNCLGLCSGRLVMDTSRNSQVWKTLWYLWDRCGFLCQLEREIQNLANRATRHGLLPAVRFNGSSDVRVDFLAEAFPSVAFYDYTKNFMLAMDYLQGKLPANYHVTLSRSETNEAECKAYASFGGNVAVVFRSELPSKHYGRPVIDGDVSDVRFQDPAGCIVGLTAKGKAKKDNSGFVVDSTE